MGAVVCAIPDLCAVGSALLRPRPRAVGSLGGAGHKAHATVVHGCAIASHRRGHASAASRPREARARVVEHVRLSAQPPADRSVQRLMQRCRWTAPADCWAARGRSGPPSARQRARTDAAPCLPSPPPKGPCGRHRRRCALPVPLLPATPQPPLGALRIAGAPGGKRHRRSCRFLGRRSAPPWASSQRGCRPASVPLWSFLPPWKALQCTAVGLLR